MDVRFLSPPDSPFKYLPPTYVSLHDLSPNLSIILFAYKNQKVVSIAVLKYASHTPPFIIYLSQILDYTSVIFSLLKQVAFLVIH